MIICPALKDPENGSVDDGDNLPGTTAKYACDDGFRLVGSSKRLCQRDGSWAGRAPTCVGKEIITFYDDIIFINSPFLMQ